jgi:hypothetical protein
MRLILSGVSHELNEVPLTGERQLFLTMAPGVVIELVSKVSIHHDLHEPQDSLASHHGADPDGVG